MAKMNTEIKNIKRFLKSDEYKRMLERNMLELGGNDGIIKNHSIIKHFKSIKAMYHFLNGFYSYATKSTRYTVTSLLIIDMCYMDTTPVKCKKGYNLIFN